MLNISLLIIPASKYPLDLDIHSEVFASEAHTVLLPRQPPPEAPKLPIGGASGDDLFRERNGTDFPNKALEYGGLRLLDDVSDLQIFDPSSLDLGYATDRDERPYVNETGPIPEGNRRIWTLALAPPTRLEALKLATEEEEKPPRATGALDPPQVSCLEFYTDHTQYAKHGTFRLNVRHKRTNTALSTPRERQLQIPHLKGQTLAK